MWLTTCKKETEREKVRHADQGLCTRNKRATVSQRARGSQKEPEWESQLSIWKACYKKEASLTFLAYLNIVLLQNN